MNLNETAENAYITSIKRQENGAAIKIDDIFKHIAGEVIKAQEARLLWIYDTYPEREYAEELADIIICTLIAAARDGINIENAVNEKMHKNAQRAALQGDKL